MGILAGLRLTKIQTMAQPNSLDIPPKRTKKVQLGIKAVQIEALALAHNLCCVLGQDPYTHGTFLYPGV